MRQLNSTLIFTTMLLCVGPICAAPLSSPEKIITFVEINDLHAHLAPHKDLVAATTSSRYHRRRDRTKIVERGGIARIATIVESIRKQNPNTLVLNVGDTFHGGVEAKYTLGNAIVPAVNALQIDVGVPGNWDFAYGPYVTRARYTPARVAFLNPLKFLLPEEFSGTP